MMFKSYFYSSNCRYASRKRSKALWIKCAQVLREGVIKGVINGKIQSDDTGDVIKEHAIVHIRVAKILYFIPSIYILMIEKIHTFFMIDTSAAIFLVSIWRVTFFFINFSFRTMISVSTFALKLLSSHIMLLIILKAKRKSWPWFVHTNWAVYVTYQYQTFLH